MSSILRQWSTWPTTALPYDHEIFFGGMDWPHMAKKWNCSTHLCRSTITTPLLSDKYKPARLMSYLDEAANHALRVSRIRCLLAVNHNIVPSVTDLIYVLFAKSVSWNAT